MRISVVIPTLFFEDKRAIVNDCLNSIQGQYDELIVIAERLDNLSEKINKGLHKTSGDFIFVCNDDITMYKGTLEELCDPDHVTVPTVIGGIDKLFHGHAWMMSRKIYEDVGDQWEGYDGFYYDDSDYWMKIEAKGYEIIKREDVVVLHPHPATTLSQLRKDGREEHNRKLFVERWGKDKLRRIQ